MDFSERFSQVLQATLGMEMHGQLGEPGLVRFSPSTVTFGTECIRFTNMSVRHVAELLLNRVVCM